MYTRTRKLTAKILRLVSKLAKTLPIFGLQSGPLLGVMGLTPAIDDSSEGKPVSIKNNWTFSSFIFRTNESKFYQILLQ